MTDAFQIETYYQGKIFDAWQYFGAHPTVKNRKKGFMFRVYAPSAADIAVIGEFSGWESVPMERTEGGVVWETFVPGAKSGQMYKFRIRTKEGKTYDRADPYAFYSEIRPGAASILYDLSQYSFGDGDWMRKRTDARNRPLNIYEMHMGSWRRKKPCGEGEDPKEGWYTYDEVAKLLIPYLKENGFNAVELMPLCEYPADESWGYQATGFFSATARYGEPDRLRNFVDLCHEAGIAVILDVVTVHFAVNDYGLWQFDGSALYEYPSQDIGRSEWGSCNFMHAHGDVRSFLQSSCNFWLTEFHFDGLRFDAVSNLIYWQGEFGRGENKEAIGFLQVMNRELKTRHPGALLIAEDSTMFEKTTWQAPYGGLHFDYKWDLGWMNDTLEYLHESVDGRRAKYGKLLQSMQYYHQAYYLLPLSHDEVVHEKGMLVEKIYGSFEERIEQLETLYLYMMAHPGKKLNFMGNEMALTREWDEKRELDWRSLMSPVHKAFHEFTAALNNLYLEHSALWERDYTDGGFMWLEKDRPGDCLIAFARMSASETITCVCNFSDRTQYVRLPEDKVLGAAVLLQSGSGEVFLRGTDLSLAPFSGVYLHKPTTK